MLSFTATTISIHHRSSSLFLNPILRYGFRPSRYYGTDSMTKNSIITSLPFLLTEKKALEIASDKRDRLSLYHYDNIYAQHLRLLYLHKPRVFKLQLPTYAYMATLLIHLQDMNYRKTLTTSVTLDYGYRSGNKSTRFRHLNPHPFDPEDWIAINNYLPGCNTSRLLHNLSPSINTSKHYHLLTSPKYHWKVYDWDVLQFEYTALYMPVYWITFDDKVYIDYDKNRCRTKKTSFIVTADDKYSPRIYKFNDQKQYTNKFTNNTPFMDIIIEQLDHDVNDTTAIHDVKNNSKDSPVMNIGDTMTWPPVGDDDQLPGIRLPTNINRVIDRYMQRKQQHSKEEKDKDFIGHNSLYDNQGTAPTSMKSHPSLLNITTQLKLFLTIMSIRNNYIYVLFL
ncbi:hypothetical protein BDA99DRAFT_593352 [Phascolomyces articulosus]|uniref:Uncharacterized protein n=1 Tax=Phascolomyces articulosus TaxID=60185 RepID=A0AAD5PHL6_9FUNG|nr:hypothetical protein BDA99DRAFT_593352 [Phascolomyces articulosus]